MTNPFEEYVNTLETKEEPAFEEAFAGLWNFVMVAAPTPIWLRHCRACGRIFPSPDWRACLCDECEDGEE